jgi:hypothetical protein
MPRDSDDRFGRLRRRQAPEPEVEQIEEEGQEVGLERDFGAEQRSPERAARLHSQMGNQGAMDVLGMEGGAELELEAPEMDGRKVTPRISSPGMPNVPDGGGGGGADWDLLWGDDDDYDGQKPRVPPPRAPPDLRRVIAGTQDREARPAQRRGDPGARQAPRPLSDALWRWLHDPTEVADPSPTPEALVSLEEGHPLARCARANRFLARCAADPLARALAAAPAPGGGGMAARVARAAARCNLAVQLEAGPLDPRVDPAVHRSGVARALAVALEADARDRVEALAPQVSKADRLAAHLLLDACTEGELPDPPRPAGPPHADLLEAALREVARHWPIPDPPRYPRHEAPETSADPQLAALDALLRAATGARPETGLVDAEALGRFQHGAWALLERAGVAQVEVASAGVAAWRVAGEGCRGRVRASLVAADRRLREVAKATFLAGKRCESLAGAPLSVVRRELEALGDTLEESADRLRRLRDASFSATARLAAEAWDQPLAARSAAPAPSRSATWHRPLDLPLQEGAAAELEAACRALSAGRPEVAAPALAALAREAPAPLDLAAGVLASGALLALGRTPEAAELAALTRARAADRGQWPAHAAAAIDQATALGPAGVAALAAALTEAQSGGDQGVLLQARALELAAAG